jgi:hypothetical protein
MQDACEYVLTLLFVLVFAFLPAASAQNQASPALAFVRIFDGASSQLSAPSQVLVAD